MATIVKIGKRWYIRLKDGNLLKSKGKSTARYFNSRYVAEFILGDINSQERS